MLEMLKNHEKPDYHDLTRQTMPKVLKMLKILHHAFCPSRPELFGGVFSIFSTFSIFSIFLVLGQALRGIRAPEPGGQERKC